MLSYFLENPALAICIVFAILIVAKAFKLSLKIMKWIIVCGAVYIAVNFLHLI